MNINSSAENFLNYLYDEVPDKLKIFEIIENIHEMISEGGDEILKKTEMNFDFNLRQFGNSSDLIEMINYLLNYFND